MGVGSSFKAYNRGDFLEKSHQELKAVDVDIVRVAGCKFGSSNNIGAPNDAEPEEKFFRIGSSSNKTSISVRREVWVARDHLGNVNFPWFCFEAVLDRS